MPGILESLGQNAPSPATISGPHQKEQLMNNEMNNQVHTCIALSIKSKKRTNEYMKDVSVSHSKCQKHIL